MRFRWRTDAAPLLSHRSWVEHLEPKNRQPGTSAPTLAATWSGPLDLLGALGTHPALAQLTVESATVEGKAAFDAHGGNVRNHDLVLRAATAAGESVVVCVEAKAGEPLGATVAEQAKAARNARAKNPNSKSEVRITELVSRLCRYPISDSRAGAIRYQLLTAWAGTLADATEMSHAVFALHEFRTDERPDDKSSANNDELARFADAVLGCELPTAGPLPWCVRVPDACGVKAALYVAHLVTDLRRTALTAKAQPERP